jgi:hypothetical protein
MYSMDSVVANDLKTRNMTSSPRRREPARIRCDIVSPYTKIRHERAIWHVRRDGFVASIRYGDRRHTANSCPCPATRG